METIITGADSFLGKDVCKLFPDAYYATQRKLDISNRDNVRIQLKHYEPSIIINCGGINDLEICEKNHTRAVLMNAVPSFFLTEFAPDNATIIYISTPQVFGEACNQMPEENYNIFKPLNKYAFSKYYGELFLRCTRKKYQKIVIIRTGWFFDNDYLFFDEIKNNSKISITDNIRTQFTYTKELAEFIKHIIENKSMLYEENIFHFSSIGTASPYDIVLKTKELLNSSSEIDSIDNDLFDSRIRMPDREYMSMEYTTKFFKDFKFKSWEDSLTEYIHENYNQ